MNPFEVLWIAVPAISAVIYTLLFFTRRHDLGPAENWFSQFLAAGAVWSIGSTFLRANPGFIAPIWFLRLSALGAITIPWAMFWFTANFLSLPIRRQRLWLVVSGVAYVVILCLVLTDVVFAQTNVDEGIVLSTFNWGIVPTALFWFGHMVPAVWLLGQHLTQSDESTIRNRLKYLLVVMVLLLVGTGIDITPIGQFPIDFFLASLAALLISVTISRYQVLEMGQVFRRMLALMFVVLLYMVLASGTLVLLAGLSREVLLPGSIVAASGTAGLLLIYQPFRAWASGFVERVFLPERYNVQALIYAISQAGNRLRPLDELGSDILRELTRSLRVTHAQLFVKDELQPVYHRVACTAKEYLEQEVTVKGDGPLVNEMVAFRLGMYVDQLLELPRLRALQADEWHTLRLLKVQVLVPILVANELIGFLAMGKRHGNEPYTRQELQQTLPLLANQISIAMSNSRLFEQQQRRANQLVQTNLDLRQAQAALSESADHIRRGAARAEALVRIANRLNAQLELSAVLSAICEETARALSAPAASVSMYSDKTDSLDIVAGHGLPAVYLEQRHAIPCDVYTRRTEGTGTVIVDGTAAGAAGLLNPVMSADLNIQTCVITSMVRDSRVDGCLMVYAFNQTRQFTDDELDLMKGIASQATQAIANARLFDDAQRRLRNVEALHTIDTSITGSVDLNMTLQVILDQVKTQLGVDAADFLLLDEHNQTLDYAAGAGFRVPPIRRFSVDHDIDCAADVVRNQRMVYFPCLDTVPDANCKSTIVGESFRAYVGVPLIAKNEVKGVLEVFHRTPLDSSKEWVSFLVALGAQAAIAIDNSQLFTNLQRSNQDLSEAYESTLEGWARAMELRDQETQGHTRRVAEMTVQLARIIGVDEADLIHLRRWALLHDIGKMAISDSILLKPSALNAEEWRVMRLHPVHAYRMLLPIAFLRRALDIPYSHHEKWDGSGYPLGLKGEEIPLWARIFAVVDVWDALRSNRPYHRPWPDDQARQYLADQSGHHFDPNVVSVFLNTMTSEGEKPNKA
ncbi:MAG TPA: HD domain-containing phosphohydrolase [Anaerolineae bacterium]|jgi:response regulator RpfG family c-di-GMP phosphodiesterase